MHRLPPANFLMLCLYHFCCAYETNFTEAVLYRQRDKTRENSEDGVNMTGFFDSACREKREGLGCGFRG